MERSSNRFIDDMVIVCSSSGTFVITGFTISLVFCSIKSSKFISGVSALPDAGNFTVISDNDECKVVIGYAEINTNRVTIPVETEELSQIENVAFSSNLLKDVLTANKECESATLEISSKGLARIQFKVDDYDALYYLVAETND